MEDRVDLPPRGNAEMEGHVGDNFLNFKRTGSFHLELLGSVHVEVGGLKSDFVPSFPGSKFGGYPLLYFLLGYLVDSLGIISSSR